MVYLIDLIWDRRSVAHIDRHNVTRQEVYEVCFANHYSRRVGRGNRHRRRYMVIGQSEAGRYLTVFVDFQSRGIFYPITARDASENERRRFQAISR